MLKFVGGEGVNWQSTQRGSAERLKFVGGEEGEGRGVDRQSTHRGSAERLKFVGGEGGWSTVNLGSHFATLQSLPLGVLIPVGGGWLTVNLGRICEDLKRICKNCWLGGVNWQPKHSAVIPAKFQMTPHSPGSTLFVDPLLSLWILPKLTVNWLPPTSPRSTLPEVILAKLQSDFPSWLSINPPPSPATNFNLSADPELTVKQPPLPSPPLPPHLQISTSLQILFELTVNWTPLPFLLTYKFQPLCRSSLSWLLIDPLCVDLGTINRFWTKFFTFQLNRMPFFTEDSPIGNVQWGRRKSK